MNRHVEQYLCNQIALIPVTLTFDYKGFWQIHIVHEAWTGVVTLIPDRLIEIQRDAIAGSSVIDISATDLCCI